jgi:hypothetical protein
MKNLDRERDPDPAREREPDADPCRRERSRATSCELLKWAPSASLRATQETFRQGIALGGAFVGAVGVGGWGRVRGWDFFGTSSAQPRATEGKPDLADPLLDPPPALRDAARGGGERSDPARDRAPIRELELERKDNPFLDPPHRFAMERRSTDRSYAAELCS